MIKKIFAYTLIIPSILLTLCSCYQQPTIPDAVFDSDIIYSTIKSENDYSEQDVLGYYNLEESSGGTFVVDSYDAPIHPYILTSSSIIFLRKKGYYGYVADVMGDLLIYSNDYEKSCEKGGSFLPYKNEIALMDWDSQNIYLLNGEDCSVKETLLRSSDLPMLPTINGTSQIYSFSLSSDGSFLILEIFSKLDVHQLYKVDLSDKKGIEKISEGRNPSISPDQTQITYVASDGIHVTSINGLADKLLIPIDHIFDGSNNYIFPEPQWSSDSKKLVYHKCINTDCSKISDYNIYIYDLETNQEKLIVKGGYFPSWNYLK